MNRKILLLLVVFLLYLSFVSAENRNDNDSKQFIQTRDTRTYWFEPDVTYNVRDAAVGNVVGTVSGGTAVPAMHFNDSVSSDGYRWTRVQYNNNSNRWMQYDPDYVNLYGDCSGQGCPILKIDSQSARMRESEINGDTIITLYPSTTSNTNFWVLYLSEEKYSDHYRWMYVSDATHEGWVQYDPDLMHLAN